MDNFNIWGLACEEWGEPLSCPESCGSNCGADPNANYKVSGSIFGYLYAVQHRLSYSFLPKSQPTSEARKGRGGLRPPISW